MNSITIDRKIINKTLKNADKMMRSKVALPFVSSQMVALKVVNNTLEVSSSCKTIYFQKSIAIENKHNSDFFCEVDSLPLKAFVDKAKSLNINFTLTDSKGEHFLKVSDGTEDNTVYLGAKIAKDFDANAEEENEYCEFPNYFLKGFVASYSLTLKSDIFIEMVSRCRDNVAAYPTKYSIDQVLLEYKDGVLSVVASDGRVLVSSQVEVESTHSKENEPDFSYTINYDFLMQLMKAASFDEDVIFQINPTMGIFRFLIGNEDFALKNIENGEYAPYRDILQRGEDGSAIAVITVDRDKLIKHIERAKIVYSIRRELKPIERIKLSFNAQELTVTSVCQTHGKNMNIYKNQIEALEFDGKEMFVAVKTKLILRLLKAIKGETVTLSFMGDTDPIFLHSKHDVIKSKSILMPMRKESAWSIEDKREEAEQVVACLA